MKTLTASREGAAHLRRPLHVQVQEQVDAVRARRGRTPRATCRRARRAPRPTPGTGLGRIISSKTARSTKWYSHAVRLARPRLARGVGDREAQVGHLAPGTRLSIVDLPAPEGPETTIRLGYARSLNVLHLFAQPLDLALQCDHLAAPPPPMPPCCRSCWPRAPAPGPGSRAACPHGPRASSGRRACATWLSQALDLLRDVVAVHQPHHFLVQPRLVEARAPGAASAIFPAAPPGARALLVSDSRGDAAGAPPRSPPSAAAQVPLQARALRRRASPRRPVQRPADRVEQLARALVAEPDGGLDAPRARPGSARRRTPAPRRPGRARAWICAQRLHEPGRSAALGASTDAPPRPAQAWPAPTPRPCRARRAPAPGA